MGDLAARTSSSSLAITERKAQCHRPGGCVGIFFQLFDWNRRFAKKKLFPKKLLPPARAKVSKRFNADEKLPLAKHLLIAEESSDSGFSYNMKKNGDRGVGLERKKHEMQSPGLVARLMGLQAIPVPAMQSDNKSNKHSPKHAHARKGKEGTFGGKFDGLDKEDLSLEKGNVRHELRPQKIQKIGVSERRPVTRIGTEALQIKNVLSRSRKHNHHKLASPVKSPKMGRNSSRLIDCAARILEPSIQATNRARSSLSYSKSMAQPYKEAMINEVKEDMDLQTPSSSKLNAPASCRSCANFMGLMDTRSSAEEYSARFNVPASISREAFFCGLEESRSKLATYPVDEKEVVLLTTRYPPECITAQAEDNRPTQSEPIRNSAHQTQHRDQISATRMFTSQKDESRAISLKHRTQRQGQMSPGDRIPPRSKLTNTSGRRVSSSVSVETKDFIALNRNISRTRLRVPSKPDNSVESDRRFSTGKSDSLATLRSPVRKRRTHNVSSQAENPGSESPLLEKQKRDKSKVMIRNGPRIRPNSVNQNHLKSKPDSQRGSKDVDVMNSTLSSQIKSNVENVSQNEVDVERRDPIGQLTEENSEENRKKIHYRNSFQMNGDALGALLEKKLDELKYIVENEASIGFVPSAKTTASILQELISALTPERPILNQDGSQGPDLSDSQSCGDVVDIISQAKSRIRRSSDEFSHEVDHFSPGCVLDASFSNESCISSSIDYGSGHILQSDYTDLSHDIMQPFYSNTELLDSASSANKGRSTNITMVANLLSHTSSVLQNINFAPTRLTGTKLDYVQEILLNSELLFGNPGLRNSSRFVDFLLGPFLNELETLVVSAWKNTIILGFEVMKEEKPLRSFLFDCLMECLDVKYNRYVNCGSKPLSRLPTLMNAELLVQVFDEEVRKWASLAGKTSDEIIETDMSTSLGKWTDFEIESFEIGSIFDQDIVQILVDEIVIDLCGSELSIY